jgi:hypothetical protein
MQNFIVTTTINEPTEALIKFAETGWNLIIIGDFKTPHPLYNKFAKKYKNVSYLHPEKQDRKYHMLSENIGWNCIQRRNIGIVEAYNKGADIIALVDDDNIPEDHWGKDLLIGKKVVVDCYDGPDLVFDPLSVTDHSYLWHRGFPIQLLNRRIGHEITKREISVEVQADLWNGAPDIDAVCRISYPDEVLFHQPDEPFSSNMLCPFNSQNTFLSREAIEHYFLFPHIGRMDDIWGSYVLQEYIPHCVVYNRPSVFQKRNTHNIVRDLKDEIFGYERTIELVSDLYYWTKYLPDKSLEFVKYYTEALHGSV